MWKTSLYTLDHQEFRRLVSSGEGGLARLASRERPGEKPLSESDLEMVEGVLRDVEARGSVEPTDDRRTNDLVNHALWLVAEEAGVDAPAGGVATESLEEAHELLTRSGWLRKPMIAPEVGELLAALHEGRVYGTGDAWDADTRTAVLDPGEVRTLLAHLRAMADARGSKLPSSVQDLLDQHLFPTLEAAARAQLGVFTITRRVPG